MTAIAASTAVPTSQVPNAVGVSTGAAGGVATGFEALLALIGAATSGEAMAPDAAGLGAETLKPTLDPLAGQSEAAAQAAAGLVAAMSQPAVQSFMAPLVAEDVASPPVSAASAEAPVFAPAVFTPPMRAQPADGAPAVDPQVHHGAAALALANPVPADVSIAAPATVSADAVAVVEAFKPAAGPTLESAPISAQVSAPVPSKAPDLAQTTPRALETVEAVAAPQLAEAPQAASVAQSAPMLQATASVPTPVAAASPTPASVSTPASAPVTPLVSQPEVVSVVGVMAAPVPVEAAARATLGQAAPVATQLAAASVVTPVAVKAVETRAASATKTPDAKVEAAVAPVRQAVQAVEAGGSPDADAGGDANSGDRAPVVVADAPVAAESAAVDAVAFAPIQSAPATPSTATPLAAAQVTPETVTHLSTEIARKTDGKSTRFDIVLTPEGLGRVDVRVEIAADGKLSAALAFDNPQAASDLRNKAGELRQALANAGFDVADNALKFDLSSSGGQGGQGGAFDFQNGENGRRAFSGRAFQGAVTEDLPPLTAADLPPGLRMAAASGLDVRI